MMKSHTLDSSITVWLLCLCSDILGIVEKSALLTLTPTLYVDPYPHYFICRYLRTNTNMRDQLSTRKLKHLFTTRFTWHSTRGHLHSLWGYPTMTPIYYMATFSSSICDPLCHGMARGDEKTSMYRTRWLIWFCYVSIFYILPKKYLTV